MQFRLSTFVHLLSVGCILALIGAGCARSSGTPDVEKDTKQDAAPIVQPASILSDEGQTPLIDEDFVAGSGYMRETPERYADLNGRKPYAMYFYADWDKESRTYHPLLVQLFNEKSFDIPLLRVNLKDNQVTDEGVEWANRLGVTSTDTFIVFDALGKEVTSFVGRADEAKLRELMSQAK